MPIFGTDGVRGLANGILTAGVVVSGNAPKRVLIRAVGPTLGSFGVTGFLTDPTVRVLDARGASVGVNDNWSSALSATFTQVGAFPLAAGSRDAALVATLPPGGYTAIVSGAATTSGVALVEVYETDSRRPVVNGQRLSDSARDENGDLYYSFINRVLIAKRPKAQGQPFTGAKE